MREPPPQVFPLLLPRSRAKSSPVIPGSAAKVFKSDGSSVEVAADEVDKYMAGEHDVVYDPKSGL